MDKIQAKQRFNSHRNNAKKRGVPFRMTFDEWLDVWGEKLDQRGVHPHEYGMCRVMDRGPYAVGNVFIGTPKRNGYTRRIVNHDRRVAEQRKLVIASPPDDQDWEEANPWLPDEFKDRRTFNFERR